MTATANSYDVLPYEGGAFVESHPDRLATLATLFGLNPPPLDHCRVLEVGCARGDNLIPMALHLPGSTFLGIDRSHRQIDEGRRIVMALGVANVELLPLDILDFGADRGPFDYIIAHGIYSWVPPPVRDRILEICAAHLSPQGVGYVSYNTQPGWFVRQIIRDLMLYHAKQFDDPREQVRQGKQFLIDVAAGLAPDPTSTYGPNLQGAAASIGDKSESALAHDFLEEYNDPIYFHQFAEHITAKGLRYLTDARPMSGSEAMLPPAGIDVLRHYGTDPIRREQCLDFLCRRAFRRSLICRTDGAPLLAPRADQLRTLHFASSAVPADAIVGSFRTSDGRTVAVAEPAVRDALRALAVAWPRTLTWDELRAAVGGRDTLADHLLWCVMNTTLLEISVRPWSGCATVSERPTASSLSRLQAKDGGRATNARHMLVALPPFLAHLLMLLDGTRDRSELVAALTPLVADGTIPAQWEGRPVPDREVAFRLVSGALEESLVWLARQSLLVG